MILFYFNFSLHHYDEIAPPNTPKQENIGCQVGTSGGVVALAEDPWEKAKKDLERERQDRRKRERDNLELLKEMTERLEKQKK